MKNRLIPLILIFLFVLVACGQGGEETPEPQQEQTRMPTPAISPTAGVVVIFDELCPNGATFSADETARGIRALCLSGPAVPTNTPKPTPTLEPTATSEPTVTPEVTLTPPPITSTHVITEWHPLTKELGHHHGVDPHDYTDVFGPTLEHYLDTYGSISYPWQTPNENEYKHKGYFWLYDEAVGGCEKLNEPDAPCVTHVLMQVHSIGTPQATITRFHSQYVFARVCNESGLECGIVATGGHVDYGTLHAPYKNTWCRLDSDPPGWETLPDNQWQQNPYSTAFVEPPRANGRLEQFWNSLGPNAFLSAFFPHDPNYIVGLAWLNTDAWAYHDPIDCANPEAATIMCPDGSCDYNHTRFQVYSVRLKNLPPAPFNGFTDRWGHIEPGCEVASVDCVPLVVTDGTPPGTAWLNRPVMPDTAPVQEFDRFDEDGNTVGWITFPVVNIPED